MRGASSILSLVDANVIFESYVINLMLYHTLLHDSEFLYWSSYCLITKYSLSWVSLVSLSSFISLAIRFSIDYCFSSRVEFLGLFGFSLWSADFQFCVTSGICSSLKGWSSNSWNEGVFLVASLFSSSSAEGFYP